MSKANTGNVKLNLVDVDICSLLRQVYLEYEDRVEETDLIFRFRSPEEKGDPSAGQPEDLPCV